MRAVSDRLRKLVDIYWLPNVMALAGGITYVLHALWIARTKMSFLDEGLYLYKGLLFAKGLQIPFADYGVWTNHAILSFLVPGYIQKWFGAGLETGRYFMIILSLFTLLGLWVFARRWGNPWWAAGFAWVMALNPAEVKLYTLAISEGFVAALMVWMLVLTIGEGRPRWQVLLGAALTAPLVLTRENMAFVPLILLPYIFWQHGWKTGLLASFCSAILFVGGNAFYFPDNLKFWVSRTPGFISKLLSNWQVPGNAYGQEIPEPEEANLYRMILYFWLIFRLHFVTLVSALTAWLLWPFKLIKPMTERMRAAIFLSILLLVLFVAHVQASFFGEFCISCILLYVGYFDFVGLMLLVIAAPFLVRELSRLRLVIIFIVMTLLIYGIGFSSHEDLSSDFAKTMIDRLDGVYVWNSLLYITKLPHLILFRTSFMILASTLVVLVGGVALVLVNRRLNNGQARGGKIGLIALNVFLIVGLILSPTIVLGKGNDFFDCGGTDVFASYRKAGQELSAVIEPGSKIYWEGRSLAIFLYLPDVQIYPPQMNHVHSFEYGGDADILYRYSHWNDTLAKQWLGEADYIMVQNTEKVYLTDGMLESGKYVKVMSSPKLEKCRWQSVVTVYKRAEQ